MSGILPLPRGCAMRNKARRRLRRNSCENIAVRDSTTDHFRKREFFPSKLLKNKPAQIRVLCQVPDVLPHIGIIDAYRLARAVGRRKRNLVEHPLHYGLQPARADVLDVRVYL